MKSKFIYHAPGISWGLFADERMEFYYNNIEPITDVLCHVRKTFEMIFDQSLVNSHQVLSVFPATNCRQTIRPHRIIFISSVDPTFLQLIYQFSHELCHFMIPRDVCDKYRWLEETLAQMMSWYSMLHIYQSRETAPCKSLESSYGKMMEYIENDRAKRDNLHGFSVSEFVSANLSRLQANCYNRPMNAAIAHEIYDLFCEHDVLWKIVPFLDQLRPDMALIGALRTLCGLANIPAETGELLTQRLCQQPIVPPQ